MSLKDCPIGFMQGRLSEMIDNKIQSFPWENWINEFEIAESNSLKIMEWTIDAENLYENPLMKEDGRAKIKYLKNKHDIFIPSLTGDCFMQRPFWKSERSLKLKLEKDFVNVCNNASAIGIKYIVVPLVDNGSIINQIQEQKLINFMRSIEQKLIKLNLKIVFEADLNPENFLIFINKLDSKIFGINYDLGNSAALGFEPEKEINLLSNRIWNVHIKDRIFKGSTVELGKGDVDFKKVFKVLSKINYKGNFILQTARAKENEHTKAILAYKNFVINFIKNL
tara:strand:+ start:24595 stop:25437 length:843 start_codon:yes stop_codon:yes gene_type:complete